MKTLDVSGNSLETTSRCPMHRALNTVQRLLHLPSSSSSNSSDTDGPIARCPMHGRSSVHAPSAFIEKAAMEALNAEILPGDPVANELLSQAREQIYHWPQSFNGFACTLVLIDDDQRWQTQLHAVSSRDYTFDDRLADYPHLSWLRYQIEELLSHREAPSVSQMASRTGVTFGTDDPVYGRQVIFQGDRMNSYYRLRDGKITQISRSYGKQKFVINIEDHFVHQKRFAARSYHAVYSAQQTGAFTKVENFFDNYSLVDDIALPQERRFHSFGPSSNINRSLQFLDLSLL